MKGKNGIANKFQLYLENSDSNGGSVAKWNSKSTQLFFLENC